jgi:alkanesulfonate monooxygenase SsuD/methylene tetrahydromethanopterin reductase-like flavin-dependent oxidoreductase (luciferase family)
LRNASFKPKPLQQPHPPIMIGASGENMALGIVARHAQMWNSFGTPEVFRHKIERLNDHCERAGRDPATIEKSVLLSGQFPLNEARRQIGEYVAAGVTHLIFSLSASANSDREFVRRFAEEIIPAYKR